MRVVSYGVWNVGDVVNVADFEVVHVDHKAPRAPFWVIAQERMVLQHQHAERSDDLHNFHAERLLARYCIHGHFKLGELVHRIEER